MDQQDQGNGLDEFERQLMAVTPRAVQLDKATLLFRAGQESVRGREQRVWRTGWLWPATAAIFACLSAGLSWHIYQDDRPQFVERVRYVEVPVHQHQQPFTTADSVGMQHNLANENAKARTPRDESILLQDHYLSRRQLALRVGLDALAGPQWSTDPRSSERQSFRELRSELGL
jgi:hypothetical protein